MASNSRNQLGALRWGLAGAATATAAVAVLLPGAGAVAGLGQHESDKASSSRMQATDQSMSDSEQRIPASEHRPLLPEYKPGPLCLGQEAATRDQVLEVAAKLNTTLPTLSAELAKQFGVPDTQLPVLCSGMPTIYWGEIGVTIESGYANMQTDNWEAFIDSPSDEVTRIQGRLSFINHSENDDGGAPNIMILDGDNLYRICGQPDSTVAEVVAVAESLELD